MNESILDKPQDQLDPSVWIAEGDNVSLTPEATDKIQKAIDYIQGKQNFPDLSVFIIGSITSNSYSEDSDIDIDFVSPMDKSKEEIMSIGWEMKSDFIENYVEKNPEDSKIGTHPLEVFFQPNPFQCMMSVGCYNFLEKKWEVGPELKENGFDPIAAYYSKGMKTVKSIVSDIRNIVLKVYEEALVLSKSSDEEFKQKEQKQFFKSIAEAGKIFKQMKTMRSSYQKEPQSKEEALQLRNDKKWHVADAAFKFLDKFGYVAILKKYCEIDDAEEIALDEAIQKVIDAVRDNFSNNKSLNDSEKEYFTEVDQELNAPLDEGIGDAAKLIALASLISVPGLVPQKALAQQLASVPKRELRINSTSVKKALETAATDKRQFNDLSFVNLTNLVATVIYNEAMIDYVKFQDERCLIAIANVISNRAGGDPSKFADKIREKSQFYSAKHVKGGYDDASYKIYDPRSGGHLDKKMERAWKLANQFAVQAIDGTLASVIGKRNMIGNAKLDDKGAWQAWGKDCDLVIGRHSFGYQRDRDGYASRSKQVAKTYVVKAGDSLSSIAKKLGTDINLLVAKNNLADKNKIKVGQTLRI